MKIETPNDYVNATQAYTRWNIPRTMLKRLAADGRIHTRRIEDDYGVLNLYLVADIEKIVNGSDNANA